MTASGAAAHRVPEVFAPVLQRLREDAAALPTPGSRLVPLGHHERPFSYVLRAAVLGSDGEQPLTHLFVKVYKASAETLDTMRQRVASDYAATRRTYDAMQRWPDLGVVRPVACYPESLALVTEEARGVTLEDFLLQHASWFPSADAVAHVTRTVAGVGRWIRAFQGTEAPDAPVAPGSFEEYIDHRLRRLAQHRGSRVSHEDRARILSHIAALAREVPAVELRTVPVHADMALGNILVGDGRTVVLDFAMARRGTALHDLTRVYVQIGLLGIKPRLRPAVVSQVQAALLAGFDPALTPERPLFRLLALLHHVNHLATVTLRPAPLVSRLYNQVVRTHHRSWLMREVARGQRAA